MFASCLSPSLVCFAFVFLCKSGEMLGKETTHRAEHNTNGHFLYHLPQNNRRRRKNVRKRRATAGGEESELVDSHGRKAESQRQDIIPDSMRMTFDEWLEMANKTHVDMEDDHWYFRLIACGYMGPEYVHSAFFFGDQNSHRLCLTQTVSVLAMMLSGVTATWEVPSKYSSS